MKPFEPFDTVGNYQTNIQTLDQIVHRETDRLQEKKASVDNALFTQHRRIEFDDNLKKRQQAYNRILIYLVISLTLIFVLFLLQRFLSFIPAVPLTCLILLVFLIYAVSMYRDIQSRWNMNFDEYNFSPPALVVAPTTGSSSSATTGSFGGLNGCIGSYCCSTGTVWNSSQGQCILDLSYNAPKPNESFESFGTW
jgi:hypothetical protein